ncbi:MAG: phosphoribosylformylglycinamidine synthase subunit PurS [Actinomycetota bacterium]
MKRQFQVTVYLKEGLADPQGKAIEDASPAMGWGGVSDVRVGKHITLNVEAETDEAARRVVQEMADRLLSNPVIEEYWIVSVETGE